MDAKLEAVQESIKLALDAADAATDVTSEYNKVRKAHAILESKVKQIHKYTTVVFVSSIASGLIVVTVSAFLFMQGSDKLSNMTETSREALVVFAENVDGVNTSLKNLDIAIKKQGDLLKVNEKIILTMDKVEKRIQVSNDNTIGELRLITKTLVDELNQNSAINKDNNKALNASLKKMNSSSRVAINIANKAIKSISNKNTINKLLLIKLFRHSKSQSF